MGDKLSEPLEPGAQQTTPEELGGLYNALANHPLGALAIAGVTREEYIARQGQVGPVVIEDGEVAKRVLEYVQPRADADKAIQRALGRE